MAYSGNQYSDNEIKHLLDEAWNLYSSNQPMKGNFKVAGAINVARRYGATQQEIASVIQDRAAQHGVTDREAVAYWIDNTIANTYGALHPNDKLDGPYNPNVESQQLVPLVDYMLSYGGNTFVVPRTGQAYIKKSDSSIIYLQNFRPIMIPRRTYDGEVVSYDERSGYIKVGDTYVAPAGPMGYAMDNAIRDGKWDSQQLNSFITVATQSTSGIIKNVSDTGRISPSVPWGDTDPQGFIAWMNNSGFSEKATMVGSTPQQIEQPPDLTPPPENLPVDTTPPPAQSPTYKYMNDALNAYRSADFIAGDKAMSNAIQAIAEEGDYSLQKVKNTITSFARDNGMFSSEVSDEQIGGWVVNTLGDAYLEYANKDIFTGRPPTREAKNIRLAAKAYASGDSAAGDSYIVEAVKEGYMYGKDLPSITQSLLDYGNTTGRFAGINVDNIGGWLENTIGPMYQNSTGNSITNNQPPNTVDMPTPDSGSVPIGDSPPSDIDTGGGGGDIPLPDGSTPTTPPTDTTGDTPVNDDTNIPENTEVVWSDAYQSQPANRFSVDQLYNYYLGYKPNEDQYGQYINGDRTVGEVINMIKGTSEYQNRLNNGDLPWQKGQVDTADLGHMIVAPDGSQPTPFDPISSYTRTQANPDYAWDAPLTPDEYIQQGGNISTGGMFSRDNVDAFVEGHLNRWGTNEESLTALGQWARAAGIDKETFKSYYGGDSNSLAIIDEYFDKGDISAYLQLQAGKLEHSQENYEKLLREQAFNPVVPTSATQLGAHKDYVAGEGEYFDDANKYNLNKDNIATAKAYAGKASEEIARQGWLNTVGDLDKKSPVQSSATNLAQQLGAFGYSPQAPQVKQQTLAPQANTTNTSSGASQGMLFSQVMTPDGQGGYFTDGSRTNKVGGPSESIPQTIEPSSDYLKQRRLDAKAGISTPSTDSTFPKPESNFQNVLKGASPTTQASGVMGTPTLSAQTSSVTTSPALPTQASDAPITTPITQGASASMYNAAQAEDVSMTGAKLGKEGLTDGALVGTTSPQVDAAKASISDDATAKTVMDTRKEVFESDPANAGKAFDPNKEYEKATTYYQFSKFFPDSGTGQVPDWAMPVVDQVEGMLASRGIARNSSVARDSLYSAIVQSAMPMVQQDAAVFQKKWETEFANEEKTILFNAANQANVDLSNATFAQTLLKDNAEKLYKLDITNLGNEQRARELNLQAAQAKVLSDQAAKNAARQFNAQSQNQVDQYMMTMAQTIDQQNADRRAALATSQAQLSTDLTKTLYQEATKQADIDAKNDMLREQFNNQMSYQIDQANMAWRRQINTLNTAAKNAAAQADAANKFQLSNQAMGALWQEVRDQAYWNFIDVQNTKANDVGYASIAAQTSIASRSLDLQERQYNTANFWNQQAINIWKSDQSESEKTSQLSSLFSIIGLMSS